MTPAELHADLLRHNGEFVKMTIADLTDTELLQRPCGMANHANWQLGHIIASETFFLNAMGAQAPELPAGFADRYNKKTIGVDDPAKLAKKDDLLALFDRVRASSVQFAANMRAEDLGKPGPEPIRPFSPTVGHTILTIALHATMHVGQIQALRRKLGKPVLF